MCVHACAQWWHLCGQVLRWLPYPLAAPAWDEGKRDFFFDWRGRILFIRMYNEVLRPSIRMTQHRPLVKHWVSSTNVVSLLKIRIRMVYTASYAELSTRVHGVWLLAGANT